MIYDIGQVYVLGSFQFNSCEVFDTTTTNASFQPLAERPLTTQCPVVCVVKTDVYLLGSYDSCFGAQVQKYSTTLDTWIVLSNLKHHSHITYHSFIRGNKICIYNPRGAFLESYAI